MADYIVSARKYRPATFHTVVGQRALVQTLKNAVTSGKLAHAYLFCGPRGVGKTTCARIFAKTINCLHLTPEGEACDECESCQAFREQRSYNVYELDAASNNSVDNIRELIEQVQIPPQVGRYKVFIIDEVHMLSPQAFNAFLKTLEEPPRHAIFVMCTTEKQKILPTILSRCQTYDFQRITTQDIVAQLQYIAQSEGINAEPQALQVIARKADGGMRDALSIFDQLASFTSGQVTYQATIDNLNILDYELFFRLTDAALQGNVPAALMLLDQVIRRGFDPQYFIGGWASHLRDLMVALDPATLSLIEAGQEVAQRYAQQAAACKPYFLYNALQIANECDFRYRDSRNKRLSVEIALVRICQLMNPVAAPPQPQKAPLQSAASGGAPAAAAQPQAAQAPAAAPRPMSQPVSQPAQARPVAASQPVAQPAAQPQSVASRQPVAQPQRTASQALPQGSRFAAVGQMPMRSNIPSLHGTGLAPAAAGGGAAAPAAPQQTVEMNEPVDDGALRRCWKEFTLTIPTEKLLVTSMTGARLQLSGATTCQVGVLGEEMSLRINEHRGRILAYLREHLRNTHLELEVIQLEDAGLTQAFTPRERLDEMQKESPEVIAELIETFGLELS